jgi:hypothetical protein
MRFNDSFCLFNENRAGHFSSRPNFTTAHKTAVGTGLLIKSLNIKP